MVVTCTVNTHRSTYPLTQTHLLTFSPTLSSSDTDIYTHPLTPRPLKVYPLTYLPTLPPGQSTVVGDWNSANGGLGSGLGSDSSQTAMTVDASGLPIPQEDEECTPERLEEIKSILLAIYLEHSPEKVSKIDRLLHKYNAREEEFLRFVRHKYGIPPPLPHPSAHHPNGTDSSSNPDGDNNSNATTANGFPFGSVNSMLTASQRMYGGGAAGTPSSTLTSHSGPGSVGSSSARHDGHSVTSSDKDQLTGGSSSSSNSSMHGTTSNGDRDGDGDNTSRGGTTQQPRPPTSQKDRGGNDNQTSGGDRPGGAGSRFARSLSPPPMPQVTTTTTTTA